MENTMEISILAATDRWANRLWLVVSGSEVCLCSSSNYVTPSHFITYLGPQFLYLYNEG